MNPVRIEVAAAETNRYIINDRWTLIAALLSGPQIQWLSRPHMKLMVAFDLEP
jgi:hypothetical protein